MRLNRYLASTLLTGLLVTASMPLPALGQEQSFKPQGAWAISKIDRVEQGGHSYCTLSRKYDDGVVLSLAHNQTEEYSLAIDFQKDVFQTGKPLKINLQPGPGQIRAYDMMPASEKAVVIRLGWDTGFFDALNKSQQMKVKIADKQYAFAMPEIAKGQGDLQQCMEGLKTAAKGERGGQVVAATTDVLQADPTGGKDFGAVKAGDAALSDAAPAPANVPAAAPAAAQKEQVAAQEKSVLQRFAANMSAQEAASSDDAPRRRNFGRSTEDEAEVAEAAVDAPKQVAAAAAQPRRERPDVPPPPVASAVPSQAPATASVPAPKEPELVARPVPSAPAATTAKVAAAPAATVKDAAKKTASIAAPVAAGVAAISPAAQFEKSEAETKALQKQIDDLTAQNKALQQKGAAPTEALQKQLDAGQAERAALQQKLDALEKEKASAPKAADVVATQTRVTELEAKNSQLEESLRQAQVRIGETAINTESRSLQRIAELETRLQAAQTDNNTLAKQLESFRLQQEDKTLVAVAGDWDLEQATKRFNEAEREIRRLGLQLEQERTSCNREKAQIEQMLFDPAVADKQQIARLTQLETELNAAQAKVSDTQKMVQDQVNQQVSAQVAQKTQSLEASNAALNIQIASLQKSLTDRDGSIAILQKNAGEAQANAAEQAKQTQQNAELQRAMAAKDAEIASLKAVPKADPAQVTALQAQIKSMTDAMAAKDKALAEMQNVPKADPAVAAQMTELQKSMASIRADNDTLRDSNIVLRQDAEKLRLQLTDAATNGGARADQLASLQLQIDTMKRQAATKDTQLATYQNQFASLQQETTQLKNRLSVADNSRSGSAEEVGTLTRQIQQLQRQVSDLQAEKARAAATRTSAAAGYAGITPAAGVLSAATAGTAASVAAPVAAVQAKPVAIASTALPTGAAMAGYDRGAIQSLLQKSGLNVSGVAKSSSGFAGADNFNWSDSSNVRGLASVRMLGNTGFDAMLDQYIAYQKGQCSGDFASMPSPSNGSAAKKMALYEIACVGANGQNQSASLIFFEDQGRFIAIANQIDAANMDIAMDSRDRIASFVRGL